MNRRNFLRNSVSTLALMVVPVSVVVPALARKKTLQMKGRILFKNDRRGEWVDIGEVTEFSFPTLTITNVEGRFRMEQAAS